MENYALNLIKGIKKIKPNIDIILLVFSENFSNKSFFVNDLGCTYIVLPSFKRHPISFYKKIISLGKDAESDDIIHINACSFRNFLLFSAVSKITCKRVLVSHYSKIKGLLTPFHYLFRKIYNKKFINIAVSEESGKFMFGKNYKIIPNGIDAKRFSFNKIRREAIRSKYNITDKTILVGQVGRISNEKNQMFSLRVLKRLISINANFKLMLVGKGSQNRLLKFIKRNNMQNNVILTGPITSNIEDYYSAFDCCLLPSLNEACPLALYEMLANGLPGLYSTCIPEFPNQINKERPKILQLELDVAKWADKVIDISGTLNLKRYNFISDTTFDLKTFIDNYLKLYGFIK